MKNEVTHLAPTRSVSQFNSRFLIIVLLLKVWYRRWILFLSFSDKALIYGSTIQAYGFIEGLLKLGLPGENIVFVQPPFTPPSCFNDPRVEDIVHGAMKETGNHFHNDFAALHCKSIALDKVISSALLLNGRFLCTSKFSINSGSSNDEKLSAVDGGSARMQLIVILARNEIWPSSSN